MNEHDLRKTCPTMTSSSTQITLMDFPNPVLFKFGVVLKQKHQNISRISLNSQVVKGFCTASGSIINYLKLWKDG